jgi:ribosome maturation factor RimP
LSGAPVSVLSDLQNRLFEVVEPTVVRLGCELVAVEIRGVDGRRTIRISVDRDEGLTMGLCADVNRALSAMLDVEDPIDGAYDLEVSSPGIERPVQRWEDFVEFSKAGYRARIQLDKDFPGRRRYTGKLLEALDEQILINVDGTEFNVPFDRIERANLILELEEHQLLSKRAAEPTLGD